MDLLAVYLYIITYSTLCSATSNTEEEIIRKLQQVRTMTDAKRLFHIKAPTNGNKRSSTLNAFNAGPAAEVPCKPHPTVVELQRHSSYKLFPQCITVNRCGGCCSAADVMECVEDATSTKTINALKIPLDGTPPGMITVDYFNHDTCKCQCRIKQHHCINQQTYDPRNCQCQCTVKAQQCPADKQWDKQECGCTCKHNGSGCPNNFLWNKNTCKCQCNIASCPQNQTLDVQSCTCT